MYLPRISQVYVPATPFSEESYAGNIEAFKQLVREHPLVIVNFFAPWCIWCRRFEPVYLKTASEIPDLHFHGHALRQPVRLVLPSSFLWSFIAIKIGD